MQRFGAILAVIVLPALVLPASADGFLGIFGKKTKVNPAERVPELIMTLKSDQDDRKRASAAVQLGTMDAAAFPEIVPVLVEALQSDPKANVRMDAVSSLGSLRPVSQLAGQALERAVSADDNMRVRMHAKTVLMKYRMAGYAAAPRPDPRAPHTPTSSEPPLLEPGALAGAAAREAPPPAPFPTGPGGKGASAKMPNIVNKSDDVLEFRPSAPRTLAPGFTTALPQQKTQQTPAPLPMVDEDGPSLTPIPSPSR